MKRLALILIALIFLLSACTAPDPGPPESTTPIPTDPPTILDRYQEMARDSFVPIVVTERPSIYGKKAILFSTTVDDTKGNLVSKEDNDQQMKIFVEILEEIVDDTEAHEVYSIVAFHWRSNKDNKIKSILCTDLINRQLIINDTMDNLEKILPEPFYSSFGEDGFLKLYLEQGPSAFEVAP